MDIQADIKWIQTELEKVKEPELIAAFKNLLKFRTQQKNLDWWDEISSEEKEEIREGIDQFEKGEVLKHEDVMANPRKWS